MCVYLFSDNNKIMTEQLADGFFATQIAQNNYDDHQEQTRQ